MTFRNRAIALLVIQCLLVASIAAKYLYERATRPRVWVRAAVNDSQFAISGRYLALLPMTDICKLTPFERNDYDPQDPLFTYHVRLAARGGKLVAENVPEGLPRKEFYEIVLSAGEPCDQVRVSEIDYFVPGNAKPPFSLKSGQELWVEVTVPPSGSPRAIQLALSDNGKWRVLQF